MGDLILHKCMLDSRVVANVINLSVMKLLDLKVSRPYMNICRLDPKVVQVHGLIKDIVYLVACH